MKDKLIFELSRRGKKGTDLPEEDFGKAFDASISKNLKRQEEAVLPELSEPEIVRHFTNLSRKNFSVDTHFYPLGSCTMKYNPKINEDLSNLAGFSMLHPYQPAETVQGTLRIFYELEQYLKELTGMERFSMQPAAGAHGELCGMMLAKAYHTSRGDIKRTKVIVPDSSHGTNPASAAVYGFETITIKSDESGRVDLDVLRKTVGEDTACFMLTNPNTLGLFEDDIIKIAEIVHKSGSLLYYDGANLNALLGISRPGDMGFDIVHLNLHKTFSTPHGGGGPGAGPVGASKRLVEFLPVPLIDQDKEGYRLNYDYPNSIGKIKSFYGNASVLIKAYAYIRQLGLEGLLQAGKDAVINANYLKKRLEKTYKIPYDHFCMHEFVISAEMQNGSGVHAGDIGKRLLDYGFHAPTVYFPLNVKEALMVEPTETESKETLDKFAEAMALIDKEVKKDPALVKSAPHTMPVKRCDEVLAARQPILSYKDFARNASELEEAKRT